MVALAGCTVLLASALRPEGPALTRRSVLAVGVGVSGFRLSPLPAGAAQDPTDLNRLVQGYKNMEALLSDFDAQTTNKEGEREADPIRKALGLRSTSDPLFQLDKLLQQAVRKTDPDRLEEWVEATESLNTHINNANEFSCAPRWRGRAARGS